MKKRREPGGAPQGTSATPGLIVQAGLEEQGGARANGHSAKKLPKQKAKDRD